MQNLIDLVRGLIGDTDTVDKAFSDAEIAAVLKQHSEQVYYLPLMVFSVKDGGAWQQREFRAPVGFWADDAHLFNTEYEVVIPSISDLVAGRWIFTSHQPGIYLTGTTCDVYGAAADLLSLWSGRVGYEQNGRGQALMDAAREMRKRMRPKVVPSD
jgi:hypothetical protein